LFSFFFFFSFFISRSFSSVYHHLQYPKKMSLGTRSFVLLFFFTALSAVHAAVTVYYQIPLGLENATLSPNPTDYSGPAAYNPTTLIPPPVPTPAIQNQFGVQLTNGGVPGLSINQHGSFFGFSVEMSVANQVRECRSFFCLSFPGCITDPCPLPQLERIREFILLFFLPLSHSFREALSFRSRSSTSCPTSPFEVDPFTSV
jgi:hypothetical protein